MRLSAGLLDDSLTVEHGQRGFGTLLARAASPRADAPGPTSGDIKARGLPNGALWNVGRAGHSGLMFAARIA
jgi:hypothetical protein